MSSTNADDCKPSDGHVMTATTLSTKSTEDHHRGTGTAGTPDGLIVGIVPKELEPKIDRRHTPKAVFIEH